MAPTKRGTLVRPMFIAILAGALLTRLGPFDTFSDLSLADRLAYWIGLTLLLAAQILVAQYLLQRPMDRFHWAWSAALSGLLGAIPSAFEVAWAESLLRVQRDLGISDLLAIYGDVTLVAIPLALAMRAATGWEAATADIAKEENSGRLLSQLSPGHRGQLLAIKAEDHYVRIYTPEGDSLILYRFRDAMADVSGLDGAQVHRGWWVARNAVQHVVREGDKVALTLVNGTRVPISRSYSLAARNAGLTST